MKRTTKSHVKVIMLFFTALLMFNCQNDENLPDQLQNKIETVSIDEAKNFLMHSRSNSSAKSTNNEFENLEFNKIAQEKIKGTDQLLTVIPFTTNNNLEHNRILMLKIDNEIKSVIFSMYPDENSSRENFSGKLFSYSLDGNFISGFRAKNGIIVSQFFENTSTLKTNIDNGKTTTLTRRSPVTLNEVVVQNNYRNTVHALDMFGYSSIFGNDIFGGGFNDYGGVDYYSWDAGGDSGIDYNQTNNNDKIYPDCSSFNFVKMEGVPWQEAAIKNIHFTIEIIQSITPLITSSETILLPQAVSFQMPTNTLVGNTNITPGTAASVTAKAIDMAMKQTKDYYKAVPATELMVTQFFKKALKDTFELMTPGSRLQINPIRTVPPTEYKSNWFFPDNCN